MTTATTQINITAKDSTAAAFASADRNLAGLASSALRTTAGLAGIGLSIAGAVDAIKGISQATIQFQQFTNTLQLGTGSAKGAADALAFVRSESQRLGLDLATAADQFGKLTAASKGTALEGKATRDIFSSMSEAATVLGLSADQTRGALNAFQQMISKGKVQAEELRGQLGERLPGAFGLAARAMGVTTAELDKLLVAGKVTAEDLLPKLAVELNKTFGSQAEQSAKGLQSQINRMNTAIFDLKIAIGESGLINFLSNGIELATKLGNALTGVFGGGQKLSPIEKQVSLIKTLEEELDSLKNLTHIPLIGDLLFDKKQADLLKFRIESATEDLGKMKASLAAEVGSGTVLEVAVEQSEGLSKTISDAERFVSALKKEAETVGLTSIEMKRLEAAHLGVSKTADPLISRIEQVTNEMDAQKAAARSLADDLKKIESITESVKTKEEKLADTQTELNRLMGSGLNVETYNRALKKAQDETNGVVDVTRRATDDISQLWMQAGRNIQSTLANSIFNFFDDGLKGMLKNVISTVGRIASEFAALKIAQSIGLDSMFGMGGGTGGTGSGASNALSIASIVSGGKNLMSSGFGLNNIVGGGLSMLPGRFGAFGAGLAGDAIGGLAAGGFTSGAASAASMGASFAAAAGPLMIAAAATAGLKALAGDKRMGGAFGKGLNFVGDIPIVGDLIPVVPLMNMLFGRGPLKFRQQSLQGTASAEGFDGDITNVFRAKGGLFVGNKHKSVTEQFSEEQQTLFDNTLKGFYGSAHTFAENLGLSTSLVDNFTAQVQIKSEKGKQLTEEAITGMLSGIGNDIAKNLLPVVDIFRKAGEDSFGTLSRLNNEFLAMRQGVENLGGSIQFANEFIKSLSIEGRTGFVDAAGGLEALNQKTAFFAENFLTDAERIAPASQRLTESMQELGFSSNITKEQFKALVQSYGQLNGITEDQLQGLLSIAPAFVAIKNAQNQLNGTTTTLAESERSLNDIRQELLSSYGKERGELESTISKFKSISDSLRNFRDSLSLGQLSPLTPGQKLEEARRQFNQTRSAAAGGDQSALEALPRVSQEFLQASQTYNASSAAFISDFNLVKSVLDGASKAALSQAQLAEMQLDELKSSVEYLTGIENATKTTNELLKELITATLSGSGNTAISTADIKSFVAANPNLTPKQIAETATKFGVSGSQLEAAGIDVRVINSSFGGTTVSDKQIKDFVNSGATPRQIYDAAVANGVSSTRLSAVTGISKTDIDKFVKDNKLPSFAKGTDFIAKSGLAMVHRAEAIVPSSTTEEIKKLREELSKLRAEQNQQTGDLMKVTDITSKQNADVIAQAMAAIDKNRQWNDRSMVRLA